MIFSSCNQEPENLKTFIGGEIVNPTSNYVVLSHNGKILDSIFLNGQNRFQYYIENAQQDFYLLEHRPETQVFYISPGDSLLLRANTMAFDESLHFSGTGDRENNFLNEMLLLDQQNADLLLSFYKIPPTVFVHKTDSIKQQRLDLLKSKKKLSKDFIDRAQKMIDYGTYDLKERYSYLINKYYKEFLKQIPRDFYDYRQQVDFNLALIQSTPSYRRFIDNFLVNLALKQCPGNTDMDVDCVDLFSHENVRQRIIKADELLELPALRQHFLMKLGVMGIITSNTKKEIKILLELLKEKNYPEEDLEEMIQLARVQAAYLPGTNLDQIEVLNLEGEKVTLKEITNKPTIVFLWSIYSKDHRETHNLIENLREKYEEITFIGVNLDAGEQAMWRTSVKKNGYDPKREFQLEEFHIQREIFHYYLNKLLFLDSSGKVIVGDVFVNSPDLENRILEFLNR